MLHYFQQAPERFQPVALVDATEDLARQAAVENELHDLPTFGALEEALQTIKADAVVITSPARFHTSQMRSALEAGLHVFVAKPMTYDLGEAVELVELAEAKKLCVVVDQQYRFTPAERALRNLIEENRYGPIGSVSYSIQRYRPVVGAFTGDEPFIWEQGVHAFDSLLATLDRPAETVAAMASQPPWSAYNGPTTSMGLIEFAGGLPCHFAGTFEARSFHLEFRLDMEKAAARVIGRANFTTELQVAEPGGEFQPVPPEDDDVSPAELYNLDGFHTGITTGGRVPNDGRENLRTLALVDAFLRAARSGNRETVRSFEAQPGGTGPQG